MQSAISRAYWRLPPGLSRKIASAIWTICKGFEVADILAEGAESIFGVWAIDRVSCVIAKSNSMHGQTPGYNLGLSGLRPSVLRTRNTGHLGTRGVHCQFSYTSIFKRFASGGILLTRFPP